jgi:hypothetical protein
MYSLYSIRDWVSSVVARVLCSRFSEEEQKNKTPTKLLLLTAKTKTANQQPTKVTRDDGEGRLYHLLSLIPHPSFPHRHRSPIINSNDRTEIDWLPQKD